MEDKVGSEKGFEYPYIIFKIKSGTYCVNSRHISTILQLPKYQPLPNTSDCITGIFPYRDDIIEMLDLRKIFGMPSLKEEYEDFADMLEQRKKDHIHWVKELKRSLVAGEEFTLARDPHQCAFGKWYYQYICENNLVSFHLNKIEEPHNELHQAAYNALQCNKNCDACIREECLNEILKRVTEETMPLILRLLEETKEIFKSTVYHEMVLILNGESRLGIIVDEVLSVEDLVKSENQNVVHTFQTSSYITNVKKSDKTKGLILELNIPRILEVYSSVGKIGF